MEESLQSHDSCAPTTSCAMDRFWEELEGQEKLAAQLIGWTQRSWDQGDSAPRDGSSRRWGRLTADERAAATVLGWTEEKWDDTEQAQPTPTIVSGQAQHIVVSVGATVEVWSASQQRWYEGQVSQIRGEDALIVGRHSGGIIKKWVNRSDAGMLRCPNFIGPLAALPDGVGTDSAQTETWYLPRQDGAADETMGECWLCNTHLSQNVGPLIPTVSQPTSMLCYSVCLPSTSMLCYSVLLALLCAYPTYDSLFISYAHRMHLMLAPAEHVASDGGAKYCIATKSRLRGVTTVKDIGCDRERAMREWRGLNNVDAHVLFELRPTWRVNELESYLAPGSSRHRCDRVTPRAHLSNCWQGTPSFTRNHAVCSPDAFVPGGMPPIFCRLREDAERHMLWSEQKAYLKRQGWREPDARYDDGNRITGSTVWVEGYGQGVVKYFKKSSLGASVHTVEFQTAHAQAARPSPYTPSTAIVPNASRKEIKLRRKQNNATEWLYLPAETADKQRNGSNHQVESEHSVFSARLEAAEAEVAELREENRRIRAELQREQMAKPVNIVSGTASSEEGVPPSPKFAERVSELEPEPEPQPEAESESDPSFESQVSSKASLDRVSPNKSLVTDEELRAG